MITIRIDRAIYDLPTAVRRQRLNAMATTMFALIADAEGQGELEQNATQQGVIDMLIGLLAAPVGVTFVRPPPRRRSRPGAG